jgi:hypothetical protein
MKRPGILICLMLLGSRGEIAAQTDEQRAALDRDAKRFANCVLTLQPDCVFDLTHVEALVAAGVRTPYADREAMRQLWSAPTDEATSTNGLSYIEEPSGERMTHFESLQPGEPFPAGGRLFAFVPFYQTNTSNTGRLERTGFLVAVSEDDGESWRFNVINGWHIQSHQVAALYPELAGRNIPETRNDIVPWPAPAISRYLSTTDGRFTIVEGAAWYEMRFKVRRKSRSEIPLVVSFDNPSEPQRRVTLQAMVAPDQETIEIRSPALTGFQRGEHYEVVVFGFEPETGEALFEHRQTMLFNPTYEMWQLLSKARQEAPPSL